jgi:hypothetical protein
MSQNIFIGIDPLLFLLGLTPIWQHWPSGREASE